MIHLTEIEQKVMDKYPITDYEKTCKVERTKREWLREFYRQELEQAKRLYEDQQKVGE